MGFNPGKWVGKLKGEREKKEAAPPPRPARFTCEPSWLAGEYQEGSQPKEKRALIPIEVIDVDEVARASASGGPINFGNLDVIMDEKAAAKVKAYFSQDRVKLLNALVEALQSFARAYAESSVFLRDASADPVGAALGFPEEKMKELGVFRHNAGEIAKGYASKLSSLGRACQDAASALASFAGPLMTENSSEEVKKVESWLSSFAGAVRPAPAGSQAEKLYEGYAKDIESMKKNLEEALSAPCSFDGEVIVRREGS